MLLFLALSCAPKPAEPAPAPVAPVPEPPPVPEYAKALLTDMDRGADACGDFYRYACGGWLDRTPLPADKPIWGRSFSAIRDQNRETLKAILEKAAADPSAGDDDWKRMGAYYGSCMDEAAIDAAGVTPLAPMLADVDKVRDLKGAMSVAGRIGAIGGAPFFQAYVDADYKDPSRSNLYVTEGGLALPDRDYYLGTDEGAKALLAAYEAHVAKMLAFAGDMDAAKSAKAVVALETAIAAAWVPRAELRDPAKTYNKLDRAGLLKHTPKLHWDAWLAGLGAAEVKDIVAETPDTFAKMQATLAKTDAASLRAYLRWHLVHAMAPHLAKPIFDENFAFFGQQVLGQKEPEVRWKRCVSATDAAIGEIAGKAWVKEKFPGDSKAIAEGMIQNVEKAFEDALPGLAWMDEPTRAAARGKVAKLINKIGYPDVWRDYSKLALEPGEHARNVMAAASQETARQVAKVGKPVDKTEWFMPPQAVNAYYNATFNEMVFPAGILQAPFFDRAWPAAMNYGGIGMVMGHELTHGFDDQGRKFDGDGRMSEWWSPEVTTRFEERAACVRKQYDAYEVAGGLRVNGALTLGENIADIGGLRQAYRAFEASGAPPANVPGLTDAQLFFVSFAQGWCTVQSPEFEKMLVLSNPHSPSKHRVNGPLSNLPEFHAAFACAEGTPMRPANACEVW
ncbi:MAG: M13 family metallopeptidase [Myxococcota bacterium]